MSHYVFILKFHEVVLNIPPTNVYYLISATYISVIMNSFKLSSVFEVLFPVQKAKTLLSVCCCSSVFFLVGSLFNDSALYVPSL